VSAVFGKRTGKAQSLKVVKKEGGLVGRLNRGGVARLTERAIRLQLRN